VAIFLWLAWGLGLVCEDDEGTTLRKVFGCAGCDLGRWEAGDNFLCSCDVGDVSIKDDVWLVVNGAEYVLGVSTEFDDSGDGGFLISFRKDNSSANA
jgi:hypothetical protein